MEAELEGLVSEAFWSSFDPTMPVRDDGEQLNWPQSSCFEGYYCMINNADAANSFAIESSEEMIVNEAEVLIERSFASHTSKRRLVAEEHSGGRTKKAGVIPEKGKAAKTKSVAAEKEEEIMEWNEQSSSCCNSENDLRRMHQSAGGSRRRWSTDAQSLYARKRRERINDRLRILQNLIPNGSKVDISTMLEEAAHYVKFLHLQIKLLSSEELWMYAPIAYNGTIIGLHIDMPPPL